jgi:hypothetical protein
MSETFISYARKDGLEFAEQLERALPNTWRDKRGIDPTNDFTNEIEQAIQACRRVVLCLTHDTLRENSFVRREIVYAQLYKKPLSSWCASMMSSRIYRSSTTPGSTTSGWAGMPPSTRFGA